MKDIEIKIVHLYPDLLNLYGDKGNIAALEKRLAWRGIKTEVFECTLENEELKIDDADIIFLGGGTDREMEIVCERLSSKTLKLKDYIEKGGSFIATCGGFEMLGKDFYTTKGKTCGLGILDIYADCLPNQKRLIGNIVLKCEGISSLVVGFENHGGIMNIGNYTPFGKVIKGFGNNSEGEFEGLCYKNLIATYLHGPLLPKNPLLCDKILEIALKNKYPDFGKLTDLDDELERTANCFMINHD